MTGAPVAIVGAGGWGTALAALLGREGRSVILWARDPEVAARLDRERENRRLLPGVTLPAPVAVTAAPDRVTDGAREAVVLAVPSHGLREVCGRLGGWRNARAPLVSAVKGMEEDSHALPSRIVAETLGAGPGDFAVLSGPSHAEEVGRGAPTAVVAASADPAVAARIQALFHVARLRVYRSRDVLGVELAGALKNVIAIACGIADGLAFGDNTRAALVTRGLAEMARLGVAMGAHQTTFQGLAGLGDLVVTCTSPLSRNRGLGARIGRGERLDDILRGMVQVAEGVRAARAAHALAKTHRVAMPIATQVYRVLYEGVPPMQAMTELLARQARAEEDAPAEA